MISLEKRPNSLLKRFIKYVRFRSENEWNTLNASEKDKFGIRQGDWILAKEKYAKHPFILYSSKLEEQEFMTYRRLRAHNEYITQKRKEHVPLDANADNNFPINWMEDYEFFAGNNDEHEQHPPYGTADPLISPSQVRCSGCGANLHCKRVTLPGYIPSEIFKGRTETELQTIICQRCHFLKHHNIALETDIDSDTYLKTISRIKDEYALAILIVDLLDFPCSIWPEIRGILGHKRPVFVVGNKVDLLPRDHNNYLNHIKDCLKDQMIQCGFDSLNIKHVSLISAKTGYGIEELITQLYKIWAYKGDVYLIGCTNVGKSSLFNILMNSDYCRPEATELVRRATTCPLPGTTLQMLRFPIYRPSDIRIYKRFRRLASERVQKTEELTLRRHKAEITRNSKDARLLGLVGRTFVNPIATNAGFAIQHTGTLNENVKEYGKAKWCYDTPGVMHPQQFTELLTTKELQKLTPEDMITPRAVRLKPGMTLFLAGLARLDFVNCKYIDIEWIKIIVFSSLQLPLVVTRIENAAKIYKDYLGKEILGLPYGDGERLARWPGLENNNQVIQIVGKYEDAISSEIILSSAGWVGLLIPYGGECTFSAWTPHGRGIYERNPPLIPHAQRLLGKRIRNSLAYNLGKSFVYKK